MPSGETPPNLSLSCTGPPADSNRIRRLLGAARATPKRQLSLVLALYSTVLGWRRRPSSDGGLADQSFPIVAQRLGPKLGNRHRYDSLEADRASR